MTAQNAASLELDMPLDKGIAPFVDILLREGVETYESCQGGPGHVFPEPTIRFHGGYAEGFRVYAIATTYGLPVYAIRRLWTVDDGELTGPTWEIVFRASAQLNRG